MILSLEHKPNSSLTLRGSVSLCERVALWHSGMLVLASPALVRFAKSHF